MASYFKRVCAVLSNPSLGIDYAKYRMGFSRVATAWGGRIKASSYSELLTARNLGLSPQELELIGMTDQRGHFFDVGAHIGIWTVPIALSRPRASVHAFEASPLTFAKLKQNITENNIRNTTLNQSAVFSKIGSVTFQIPKNASVFGRIYSPSNSRGRYDVATQVIVPAVTIDQYCAERDIDTIEFLKIDVEGAEFDVLKGCLRMLGAKKIRLLWIELDAINQVDFHSSIDNIANLMDSFGYAFYRVADMKTQVNIRRDREGNMLAHAYGTTP